MDFSDIAWRKSKRSTNNGACIEVGAWRKSERSSNDGSCVEAGQCGCHGIAVRDSKNPGGPKLSFSRAEWATFTQWIKHEL